MSRRVAIYARISRDRAGGGLGVARQLEDCRALAAQLGWHVATEHTDNDLSAYSGKPRPGYLTLLDDVESGRADAVVTWHTDRLHRSPAELERYIEVCERRGVPTHCVKAGPLDLASPSGRLVARQLGAVARYEIEHAIERAKRAKAQAAAEGRFRGGRRAFGYEADGVTLRVAEAAELRRIADEALAGASMRSLAAGLNARGFTGTRGAPFTGVGLRDVLLRARNAGLVEHDGEIVAAATWPAAIPEDTWRAVRALLTHPARGRPSGAPRRWLLTALARCGVCGDRVSIASPGNTRQHARPGYRCSGPHMHVFRVAEPVDELVSRVVVARLGRPDAADLLRTADSGEAAAGLHTEATALRERLDELAGLFAAGEVPARQLGQGSTVLREKLGDLERRIGDAHRGSVLEGLVGVDDVAAGWAALDLERRRAVVAELVDVTVLPSTRGRRAGGHYFDPASVRIEWRSADSE